MGMVQGDAGCQCEAMSGAPLCWQSAHLKPKPMLNILAKGRDETGNSICTFSEAVSRVDKRGTVGERRRGTIVICSHSLLPNYRTLLVRRLEMCSLVVVAGCWG